MGWIWPSGSRTEAPPPAAARVPASRDHGTAAAALPSPPRAGFLGSGGGGPGRSRPRPRRRERVTTPQLLPLVLKLYGVSRPWSASLSHLPGTRSGRSGPSQGRPGAAPGGSAHHCDARRAAGPRARASQPAPPS